MELRIIIYFLSECIGNKSAQLKHRCIAVSALQQSLLGLFQYFAGLIDLIVKKNAKNVMSVQDIHYIQLHSL